MSATLEEYLSIDPDELARLCEMYDIAELAVFGSVARREDHPGSDVDLLYTLRPGSRLGWRIEELNERLTQAIGRPVDLVSKKYLHRLLRESILREAVVIYAA